MARGTGKRGGARARAAGAAGADIEVRRIGLGDVLALVRVCNQAFLEHARFPEMGATAVRYIRDFPEWQWGAFGDGRMLGFLLTEPRDGTARVAVRLIATDPLAQGRGVGGRLLAALEKQCRERGVPLLTVGTPFARGFYEKQGFSCSKVDLKVIREIACRRVEAPEGVAVRPLDLAGAAAVVGALESDELRAKFLSAYLESFRRSPGLSVLAERDGRPVAVAVGRTSDFYRDFAEATFLHGFGAPMTLAVRCFESAVSAMGLRFVGFYAGEAPEPSRELAALGYHRAEEDYYWTMYTLEKPLT